MDEAEQSFKLIYLIRCCQTTLPDYQLANFLVNTVIYCYVVTLRVNSHCVRVAVLTGHTLRRLITGFTGSYE